jgi:hypothetical protein
MFSLHKKRICFWDSIDGFLLIIGFVKEKIIQIYALKILKFGILRIVCSMIKSGFLATSEYLLCGLILNIDSPNWRVACNLKYRTVPFF